MFHDVLAISTCPWSILCMNPTTGNTTHLPCFPERQLNYETSNITNSIIGVSTLNVYNNSNIRQHIFMVANQRALQYLEIS